MVTKAEIITATKQLDFQHPTSKNTQAKGERTNKNPTPRNKTKNAGITGFGFNNHKKNAVYEDGVFCF